MANYENVKYLSLPQQVRQNQLQIEKLLTMYSLAYTTLVAIKNRTYLTKAELIETNREPIVGDLVYGSDSHYAQIVRVGEGVVEIKVIGQIANLDAVYSYLNAQLVLKENISNKATNFETVNDTLYPSLKAVKDELNLKANKQQEAWITPTLLNGATGNLQYRKNEMGRVEFRGYVNTNQMHFCSLPQGYRMYNHVLDNTYILVGTSAKTGGLYMFNNSLFLTASIHGENVSLNSISYVGF